MLKHLSLFNKFLIVFLFLVLLPAESFAGDYANLNFIGFSKDGKFLAFEQYGVQDGSGFPYADIFFINTEKNIFAAAPVSVRIDRDDATETTVRNKANLAAAKKLRELKIVKGNPGSLVLSHLTTDLTFNENLKNNTETVRFAELIFSSYQKGDYELSLKSVPAKMKDCDIFEQEIFKLELSLKDNESGATKILQKDADLPKSRGCALSYSIQNVYVYADYIAVFLNVLTPGFEGADMRYMVVSGKMR